jgi:hypothetical protein
MVEQIQWFLCYSRIRHLDRSSGPYATAVFVVWTNPVACMLVVLNSWNEIHHAYPSVRHVVQLKGNTK